MSRTGNRPGISLARLALLVAGTACCGGAGVRVAAQEFSPDGRSLALGGRELSILDLRRGHVRRVASPRGHMPFDRGRPVQRSIGSAVWSPDSQWLAYEEHETITSASSYHSVFPRLASSDGRRHLAGPLGSRVAADNMGLAWSPDGRTLAVGMEHHEGPEGAITDLWLYDARSRKAHKAGGFSGWLKSSLAWSPKGGKVAAICYPGTGKLSVFDVKRKQVVTVADGIGPGGANSAFAWSSDGRRLAFILRDPGDRGDDAVWIASADGRYRRRLGGNGDHFLGICWPRLSTVVVAGSVFRPGEPGAFRLARFNVRTGRSSTILSVRDRVETEPIWSRDGRKCAYWTYERSGPNRLRLLDLKRLTARTVRIPMSPARRKPKTPEGGFPGFPDSAE